MAESPPPTTTIFLSMICLQLPAAGKLLFPSIHPGYSIFWDCPGGQSLTGHSSEEYSSPFRVLILKCPFTREMESTLEFSLIEISFLSSTFPQRSSNSDLPGFEQFNLTKKREIHGGSHHNFGPRKGKNRTTQGYPVQVSEISVRVFLRQGKLKFLPDLHQPR